MKEKIALLLEKLKANKGIVIRVAGVAVGALIGVAVASAIAASQEEGFELTELPDVDDTTDEDTTE